MDDTEQEASGYNKEEGELSLHVPESKLVSNPFPEDVILVVSCVSDVRRKSAHSC